MSRPRDLVRELLEACTAVDANGAPADLAALDQMHMTVTTELRADPSLASDFISELIEHTRFALRLAALTAVGGEDVDQAVRRIPDALAVVCDAMDALEGAPKAP